VCVKTRLSLYPIYYADDDMFRPLWVIFRSEKYIMRKTLQCMIFSRVAYSKHSKRSRCRLVYPFELIVITLDIWILISLYFRLRKEN